MREVLARRRGSLIMASITKQCHTSCMVTRRKSLFSTQYLLCITNVSCAALVNVTGRGATVPDTNAQTSKLQLLQCITTKVLNHKLIAESRILRHLPHALPMKQAAVEYSRARALNFQKYRWAQQITGNSHMRSSNKKCSIASWINNVPVSPTSSHFKHRSYSSSRILPSREDVTQSCKWMVRTLNETFVRQKYGIPTEQRIESCVLNLSVLLHTASWYRHSLKRYMATSTRKCKFFFWVEGIYGNKLSTCEVANNEDCWGILEIFYLLDRMRLSDLAICGSLWHKHFSVPRIRFPRNYWTWFSSEYNYRNQAF